MYFIIYQMLEAKSSGGSVEAQLYLKAQVDQLTGRNEELRRELRQARNEYEKAKVELDRAALKVSYFVWLIPCLI